ncbi:hypothetical protein Y032_0323g2474 [Ancylostoma ceylanicum]|uniref:Uncharacterized protein n=1 Tax=Ancylostoma ceylanicum TaxID=53326 RepID=A0A016S0B9_9BILA|nr:hypothetical protein Y032_0323g2474 [Ancylostoma ceylanicum]
MSIGRCDLASFYIQSVYFGVSDSRTAWCATRPPAGGIPAADQMTDDRLWTLVTASGEFRLCLPWSAAGTPSEGGRVARHAVRLSDTPKYTDCRLG